MKHVVDAVTCPAIARGRRSRRHDDRAALSPEPRLQQRRRPAHAHATARAASRGSARRNRLRARRAQISAAQRHGRAAPAGARGARDAPGPNARGPWTVCAECRARVRAQHRDRGERAPAARRLAVTRRRRAQILRGATIDDAGGREFAAREGGARQAFRARARAHLGSVSGVSFRALHVRARRRAARRGAARAARERRRAARRSHHLRRFREARARYFHLGSGAHRRGKAGRAFSGRRLEGAAGRSPRARPGRER